MNGWASELSEVHAMIESVIPTFTEGARLSFDDFCKLMRFVLKADETRLRVRPGGSRHRVLHSGGLGLGLGLGLGSSVRILNWLGLAWLGLAWLGLAWLGLA